MQYQLQSLQRRLKLAVWFTYGFFLLVLVIAAGLLYMPFAKMSYPPSMQAFVKVGPLIAILILFAARPLKDRFRPPGPLLEQDKQPRLFQEISYITSSLDQPMPKKVYLTAEPNVYITYRGGFMGFGSRKVMGVGLTLLAVLNVTELRAVLAHECGHYSAWDLKLAPRVYKTYEALVRNLTTTKIVPKLFLLYTKVFLGLTKTFCRQQEYAADAQAARFAGATNLASGLQKIPRAVSAGYIYNIREVDPLLNFGFKPPIADGFKTFLNSSEGRKAADSATPLCVNIAETPSL